MLNIFQIFHQEFSNVLLKTAKDLHIDLLENEFQKFTIEPTKDYSHGDLACNIAMIYAKRFKLNNKDFAQIIIENFTKNSSQHEFIEKIEIANAGFINIFLKNNIYYQVIKSINISQKINFPNIGNNLKINLEYASPNPTGPMHVGHSRGAIYGDVLAKLLQKVGYDVTKEYYINDAGSQINNLVNSAYIRYLQQCGKNIELPEGSYPGEYLIDIGKKLKAHYDLTLLNLNADEYFKKIRDFVVNEMLNIIKADLLSLGIQHDNYFSEKTNIHDKNKVAEIIEKLSQQNLIYKGKLEVPKTQKGVGLIPEDYEDKEQTLFKSTLFGDDQDRVVIKSDGSPTYFGADLAYIENKFLRGAKIFIMPLGFDHAGYVKRLTAGTNAITNNQAQLKIILCQMVKFVKDGVELKMSKRAGNFITAKEVVDEVGADVLRFIMLTRKNDAPFDFDLKKVIEQSKDNPIFYVQYAHTRCCSVLRNLLQELPEFYHKILDDKQKLKPIDNYDFLYNLKDEQEIILIKKITNFPRIIEMSAINFEPHRMAFYLQDLSAEFHSLWNKGIENPELKFIIKNNFSTTMARIYLIISLKTVISECLDIFNIKALEQMT